MDRRYEEFRKLQATLKSEVVDITQEQQRFAQIMQDGVQGEFWAHLKPKIDGLILDAERRFVDTLAPTYEVYVQWWSRRQALITIVSVTETTTGAKPT